MITAEIVRTYKRIMENKGSDSIEYWFLDIVIAAKAIEKALHTTDTLDTDDYIATEANKYLSLMSEAEKATCAHVYGYFHSSNITKCIKCGEEY